VTTAASDVWPWLTLAGLGAFHGLNPAMGWLFAVALGLHRKSRAAVLMALLPIAIGHAVAVAVALALLIAFGTVLDERPIAVAGGVLLIAWAAWVLLAGHPRRVRVGMQTGLAGLAAWSFVMATAHGAGLMLVPVALPLCLGDGSVPMPAASSATVALAILAVHTGAMLAVIGAVSLTVYEWVGLAFLRRGWVNFDLIWAGALAASGAILIVS
jgi:hypothetical protein